MKVGASSSAIPISTTAAFEVIASIELALTTKVSTIGAGSIPPMPSGSFSRDQASELPTEGEIGKERKNKKAITEMSRKARLSGPDGDSDEREEDTFDNPKIVQDLTDRFSMLEVVNHMADLDSW
ncbi:hypothetical protein COCNU_scaffold004181G000010 [Cocos nucifera]|nr:hypothetical protein [Cocos nucifera]